MRRGLNRTGKPPKLRFHPGQLVEDPKDKTIYRVIGTFRFEEDPHEWVYRLEDQTPLRGQSGVSLAIDIVANLTASRPVAVVSLPFRSSSEVSKRFWDVPASPGVRGDVRHVCNRDLLKWRLVETGPVIAEAHVEAAPALPPHEEDAS